MYFTSYNHGSLFVDAYFADVVRRSDLFYWMVGDLVPRSDLNYVGSRPILTFSHVLLVDRTVSLGDDNCVSIMFSIILNESL